jgi:hypothetical protein
MIFGKAKLNAISPDGQTLLNRLANWRLRACDFAMEMIVNGRCGRQNRATDLPVGQITLSRMHHIASAISARPSSAPEAFTESHFVTMSSQSRTEG